MPRTVILVAMAAALAVAGRSDSKNGAYLPKPRAVPSHYNPLSTPWLTAPLDAQAIVKHYSSRTKTAQMAIEAWPLLVMTCSPTIYADWSTLPDIMRIGAVDRQGLCKDTLAARKKEDLRKILNRAKQLLESDEYDIETQGRYRAALGMGHDDIARMSALLDRNTSKQATEEEATNWLSRQVQRQTTIGSAAWTRGRVIGPYSPVSQWETDVNRTPEEALELLQKIASEKGLVGVRLPLGWAQTPNEWIEIATRLDRIGGLIEKRTRMGRGSFGLWGRVMLDWRVADREEANAVTLKTGNFYAIQASELAVGHEWFHAYSHWSRSEGNEALQEQLFRDLRRVTYNRWQMQEIFRQSHLVLAKDKAARHWIDTLQAQGAGRAWSMRYEEKLPRLQGGRNAVYWYAQAAWTLAPQMEPGETPWIARRRALDETLQSGGWQGRGIVRAGYYVEDEELAASAFQGDLNLDMERAKLLDTTLPNSLVGTPLPIESQAMRWTFTKMFRAQARKPYKKQEPQGAGDTSSRRDAKG